MSAMLHLCPERTLEWKRRRCIVEHHEILLAQQLNQNVVEALYPTYPIDNSSEKGWFSNHAFWKEIVEEQNFPLAKVNFPPVIDPIMKNFENCLCVKLLDRPFLESLPFPNKMDLMMFGQNMSLKAFGIKREAMSLLNKSLPLGPKFDVF
jgi:hypothetical protein